MKDSPPKPATVWDRLPRGGAQGYDLAANVLVGFALGWLLQHYFKGIRPWGLVGGVVLGSASGFYQLFKANQRAGAKPAPAPDKDKPDP